MVSLYTYIIFRSKCLVEVKKKITPVSKLPPVFVFLLQGHKEPKIDRW